VVDVSNSPSFEAKAALEFFTTSTGNLLAAEKTAGMGHHVALSVVATERLPESGYFRAKLAQEKLIKESGSPYSIVHATQFFEFVKNIADSATDGDTVRLSPALIQPIAADAVASAVARTAVGEPINGTIEIAGPEQFGLDELIARACASEETRERSSPTPRLATTVPSLRNAHSSPARTPSSSAPASKTGLFTPHHRSNPISGERPS
jgi:uncharacterized protein YbjT (DUF2867 family)